MSHAAFLAGIIANPEDDDVRLIYADWLEECGAAERAEFIRVQCELAKCPCRCDLSCGYRCKWCDEHEDRGVCLRRREREILARL